MDDLVANIELDLERKAATFQAYSDELKEYLEFLERHRKHPSAGHIQTYYLYKLVEKWQPVLGFNETTISRHLLDIQTPKLEYKTSMSIKELLEEQEQPSSWLVPGLFQSCGMYIMGADPKTGKSVLCYGLSHAVCVSGEFLGFPVKKGNVLFLQLEEPLPTMRRRFQAAGFRDTNADEDTSILVNFKENNLRIERNFNAERDINWLIKKIEDHKIDLVIIDSLRKATHTSGYSENSNEFGKIVYSLQHVFNVTNTCGVVIHHLSKTGNNRDRQYNLIERLAGHTSISSASDGLIGLFDTSTNDNKIVTLRTKPRDGFEMNFSYTRSTSPDGLWEFKRTEEDTQSVTTSQILRYLGQYPDTFLSSIDIANGLNLNISNPDFVKGLQYLVELELIKAQYRDKRRYYSFASDNMWIVNPISIKSLVSPAVIDANNLMHCTTKSDIRKLVEDWDTQRKRDSLNVLLPGERERIEALIQQWEYSEDDEILVIESGVRGTIEEQVELTHTLNTNTYVVRFATGDTQPYQEYQLKKYIPVEPSFIEDIEGDDDDEEEIEIPSVLEA